MVSMLTKVWYYLAPGLSSPDHQTVFQLIAFVNNLKLQLKAICFILWLESSAPNFPQTQKMWKKTENKRKTVNNNSCGQIFPQFAF